MSETVDRDLVLTLDSPVLADLMVLAIHATQGAIAEENVPDAPGSDKRRFLAEVYARGRHDRERT
jgi:hypothetical protein